MVFVINRISQKTEIEYGSRLFNKSTENQSNSEVINGEFQSVGNC